MSGSGITPINSGPLVIRTYLDSSPNNAYVLGLYDYPISSNRVLITSANGLLAPSDNIYVSSVTLSTGYGSTAIASSLTASNVYASTLIASTSVLTTIGYSSIIGSSFTGTTGIIASALPTSTVTTGPMTIQGITGYPGNYATVNNLLANTQFATANNILANLGTVSYTYLIGTGAIRASTMSTVSVSTTSISTTTLYSNILTTDAISGISSLSTTNLYFTGGIGSTLTTGSITINSTLTGSTINATTLSFSSLIGNTLSNTVSVNNATITNILATSTTTTNTILGSTLIGSTLLSNQLSLSVGSYSTLRGSTLLATTLTTSTMFVSTLVASTSVVTTQSMSSITASTIFVSTLSGSTLTVTQLGTMLSAYSTMTGSTLFVSTVNTSTLFVSTLLGSTLTVSTLFVSTASGSTVTVNTLTGQQISVSTLTGSTMFQNYIGVSSLIVPVLNVSSVSGGSIIISSLTAGTIDGFTFGSGGGSQISNTELGYALPVNTSGTNNTAFGYASLYTNTTGSNNTAFGVQSLYSNTTGSNNTGVGYNAGYIAGTVTGSYNTYLGYNSMPSTTSVTNEIVVGGSYSTSVNNIGSGNHSVTIGNAFTAKNRIYGNLAIGSNTAGSALTVTGSYQQIGGNMTIYNTVSYAAIWLYNDGATGSGMFLNASNRGTANDGGNYTGTVRNNYGSIRFQAMNGYDNARGITILASGYVGIGSALPQLALDVVGGMRCSVDGSTTNIEGDTTAIAAYSPSATTTSASIWMGYDPTNNCGYINCARANAIRPICIQTRGGSVGVGGTTNSAYILDVKGTGHFTGALIVGGSVTYGTLTVNSVAISESQWTGTTSLSYGYDVTVQSPATFSATTYAGLPIISATVQGIVQAGPSLSASSGYLSMRPPFFQGTLSNSDFVYGPYYGNFWSVSRININQNLSSYITTINFTYNPYNPYTGTNQAVPTNGITVIYSGYYLVTLTGNVDYAAAASITLFLGTYAANIYPGDPTIARITTLGFYGNTYAAPLSTIVYISNTQILYLACDLYGMSYDVMNIIVQWISN